MSANTEPVIHVQQSYTWDCGIACLKMVLKMVGADDSQIPEYMTEIGLAKSVWTIDLAYLLSRYGITCTLYTSHLDVQDGYESFTFYKNSFKSDKERVESLIRHSGRHGFNCIQKQLTIQELCEELSTPNTVVIALVDWNLMTCVECDSKALKMCTQFCVELCSYIVSSYQGHFLLVTHISLSEGKVTFHNPGRPSGPCYCTVEMFDKARIAIGTDEDLLIIQAHRPKQ